jgi:hypothetical protein
MTVEITIIAVMLVAAATLVVAAMARARSESSGVPETGGPAGALVEPVPAIGLDELVLVPLPNRRDEALVIGSDQALSVLDDSGLTRRPTTGRTGPLPQLIRSGMAAGGLQATRHAQTGVDSGRIVALSRETMEHLDKGKPVYDKANNMLGIVKGDKGKIRHVMRLDRTGAQAVVASNAATLAITAALSQQLEQIAEQLAEISETLEGMVRDKDRERLAEIVAANDVLLGVADNVRRRGIADTDAHQLAALKLPIIAKQLEAEFKLEEALGEPFEKLTRADRADKLDRLVEKERLDYWLAVRVQADLARTRADLLHLYWEHHAHPDTATALNESTEKAIRERQERLALVGETLRALSDPEARTRLDPLRQLSRHRLRKEHAKIEALLGRHGQAFAGPDQDPFGLIDGVAAAVPLIGPPSSPDSALRHDGKVGSLPTRSPSDCGFGAVERRGSATTDPSASSGSA